MTHKRSSRFKFSWFLLVAAAAGCGDDPTQQIGSSGRQPALGPKSPNSRGLTGRTPGGEGLRPHDHDSDVLQPAATRAPFFANSDSAGDDGRVCVRACQRLVKRYQQEFSGITVNCEQPLLADIQTCTECRELVRRVAPFVRDVPCD